MLQKNNNPLILFVLVDVVSLVRDSVMFLSGKLSSEYSLIEAGYRTFATLVFLSLFVRKSWFAWHSLWLVVPLPIVAILDRQGQLDSQSFTIFGVLLIMFYLYVLVWIRPKYFKYLRSTLVP